MRAIATWLIIIWSISGFSQNRLIGVSVDLEISGSESYVTERIIFDLTELTDSIHLKALSLKGSNIYIKDIFLDGKSISFKEAEQEGIIKISFDADGYSGELHFNVIYTVEVEDNKFYIPMIFTEYPGASSENDFFQLEIISPINQEYTLHFPKVPNERIVGEETIITSLLLPALPSMLRMELVDEGNFLSFFQMVDILVAGIFIGIGFLIWKFRKYLNYG
jgi:hypothetical protein